VYYDLLDKRLRNSQYRESKIQQALAYFRGHTEVFTVEVQVTFKKTGKLQLK